MTNPPLPNLPYGKANARELSWWAEAADGMEGEELHIIADGSRKAEILKRSDVTENHRCLVVIERDGNAPQREKPQIAFRLPDNDFKGLPKLNGQHPDALFVTASAARKFVYPYYESHRLLTDQQLAVLKTTPLGKDIVGIAHYPPSRPLKVDDEGNINDPFESALVIPGAGAMIGPVGLRAYAELLLRS